MNSQYEIYKLCNFYGINKVKLPKVKLFILSIMGGFFVGLGGLASSVCNYHFYYGLGQYYSGLVFPIGIMLAYIAGAELFTENCLLVIPFFVNNITLLEMLLTWLIVLIGNFIGSILISLLVAYSHIPNMFDVNLAQNIINYGINKCSLNFGEAFIKGLLGNFYSCLAIWVCLGGRDLRSMILALWIPSFLLASCELEHVVANMYYIIVGLFTCYEYGLDSTILTWGRLFYKNLIPVLMGNILGGGALVGMGYSFINSDYEKTSSSIKKYETSNDSKADLHNDLNTLSSLNK